MAVAQGKGARQRGARSWNGEGEVGTAMKEGKPSGNGFPRGRAGGPSREVLDGAAGRGGGLKEPGAGGGSGPAPGARAAPPPGAAPRRPRLPGTEPARSHLGLKSWKRPLRFMAENFTAAASSSPRPPRRADCALQRVHGARASRVPAASAAQRNLSHRLPPLLPGFRTATARAPQAPPGRLWESLRVARDATSWPFVPARWAGSWRLGENGVGRGGGEPSGDADRVQACGEEAGRPGGPR